MRTIKIFCENNQISKNYPLGITVQEIANDMGIKMEFTLCGALVNNKVRSLTFDVVKPKNIRFIDYSDPNGMRIYIRSLFFLLYAAVKDLYPNARLKIDHGISHGYYCEIEDMEKPLDQVCIDKIKAKMRELVAANLPFKREGKQLELIIADYKAEGLNDKVQLLSDSKHLYEYEYILDKHVNNFHGHLLPSTGFINIFDLDLFEGGMLLRLPSEHFCGQIRDFVLQEKLFDIFQEHKEWAEIITIQDIGCLNKAIKEGYGGGIIKISEALHERKFAEIASRIAHKNSKTKLILLAGPSSSGKTTSSKRLAVQLAVCGIRSHILSLDNYFVDRDHTPLDENGNYDFEALNAIDLDFFNEQLRQMLDGKEIEIPKFDFQTGTRFFDGEKVLLGDRQVLIIEGIHALNPDLIHGIDKSRLFRIFISALTAISIDDQNPISTTDNRLIRRMIRDSKYRGYSALETIRRWPSVRRGEEKNIFPNQENSDVMFNSALLYELAVLKKYAEPLLKSVPENQPEYAESLRLLKLLSFFKDIDDEEIPPTSILREFLGGSSFNY